MCTSGKHDNGFTHDNFEKLLEKTYDELNDNIKFSEAKNAALITLNSALIAAGIGLVFESKVAFQWKTIVLLAILFLCIPLVISVYSFRAETGKISEEERESFNSTDNDTWLERHHIISSEPKKLMFYSYISKYYKNNPIKYLEEVSDSGNTNIYHYQLASQIVDLANVAYRKFALFNLAIKIECTGIILGSIITLIIVLVKIILHTVC